MKALKKIFKVLGIIIGLIVAAALIVPFVVDVDKYRPMIVSKAGEYIDGKLEIGKLSLSLWGAVKVKIDGVKLSDAKGQPVMEVKDASLNLPLMPIITGVPEIRLELKGPALNVVKFRDGKMNVMTLMKEQPAAAIPAPGTPPGMTPAPKAAKSDGGSAGVPAIVLKSRFTFLIEKAKLAYKDEFTGDSYNINEIDFTLRDVSLEREMPFSLVAQLDMTTMKTIKIKGPLVFDGKIKAIQEKGEFAKATASATLKLDGLDINYPGMFEKKPGVALGFETNLTAGKDAVNMPSFKFRLAEVVIDSSLVAKTQPTMNIDFKLSSNTIQIAKLGDLVPMIKQYGMNGGLDLAVAASGPIERIDYKADVKVDKMSVIHESMKQPMNVSATIAVITNKLKEATLKMTAKDFDLSVKGMLEDFLHPKFQFDIASTNMDLDGLLKASEKAAEARKAEAAAIKADPAAVSAKAAPAVDYNAMLAPLRSNPMAAATSGTVNFGLKKIRSTGVSIADFRGAFVMKGLEMSIKDLMMQIFGGSIKGAMSFNATPAKPTVATNMVVDSLSTQKMVESQMPFARNTVSGIISAKLNIGGSGLNPADVISAWKGNGDFSIKNANFSTMDFGPAIVKGVNEKVPAAAKGKVNLPESLANWKGQYDSFIVKYALDKGVFFMNEINGKAPPKKGLDMVGSGKINLKDYSEDINVDFIDRYDMIPAFGKFAKNAKYGNKGAIPVPIGCTVFHPCYNFEKAATILAKGAAGDLLKGVASKLPGPAQGAVNKILGGGSSGAPAAAPKKEDVKKALKGLFGN